MVCRYGAIRIPQAHVDGDPQSAHFQEYVPETYRGKRRHLGIIYKNDGLIFGEF